MTRTRVNILACGLLLVGICFACTDANAQSNTLSVTLGFVDLPTSITLCRDPQAIQAYGSDEQWAAFIDIDNNVNTGDPNSSGADAVLVVQTLPQSYPCVASPGADLQQSLISGVVVWDSSQQIYIDSGAPADLVLNFTDHTMKISADVSGPLTNLTPQSPIYIAAYAAYTPMAMPPTAAYDSAATLVAGSSALDAAQDVAPCAAPCSQTQPWIQMVDLVDVEASTSAPLPAFGGNSVAIEFDVADIPAMLSLCRYPAMFTNSAGFDSQYLAGLDLDGDTNTPAGSGGYEAIIFVGTPQQPQGCATNTVASNQAVYYADLETWDANQGFYVHVQDLPVTIDTANGKIVVQADRSSAALAGLSSSSHVLEKVAGLYDSADPNNAFAYDVATSIGLGGSFSDPAGDVQNCLSPCTSLVNWYSQIDLIGGSVQVPEDIFHSGFE